ncbi:MAG TPA: Stk1 family PASTA domain-containing Ser/Thr kinase [Tissierellaceae bacterium]|nr:Stk1 family PASTA domain-containing Ser/Thr kinase [Tissierellaceae bacterium]
MIGKILADRYEIVEQIGEGGMALVYKARCKLLNRYVAIKVLRNEFVKDDDFVKKFDRESQAVASLSHPNILNIYDVGVEKVEDKNVHYIVMEYIRGKTLKDIIKEKGKLDLDETINYSIQIGNALKHAHLNNIVHRDIKPQNIMVTEENIIKVTDFGIARAATESTMTVTSEALGSVHYLSPEQARGAYTDEKSDIYSLGIVMYEMITGKTPFKGETPVSVALKHVQDEIVPPGMIDDSIPDNLEAIILKCVEKRQADRYDNIEDLLDDLTNIKNNKGRTFIADSDDSDSPTRMIPVIEDEDIKDISNKSRKKKKKKKEDSRMKPIILAIVLAFIIVSVGLFGYARIRDFFKDSEVIVPEVIGMLEDEAREVIESKGLEFEVAGTTKNDDFNDGEVVSQNVKEGAKVKEGYTIKVTVNEGEETVSVPSLINKTLKEAEDLLEELGLKIGTMKEEFSNTTPKDMIMRQEPEASTQLESGSSVNIVISKGEEVKKVVMPNLIGKNSIEARNTLLGLGLEVGEIKEEPNREHSEGIVFRQSYSAGIELDSKTTVDLYVSTGFIEEEPEEDNSEDEEEKQKQEDSDSVEDEDRDAEEDEEDEEDDKEDREDDKEDREDEAEGEEEDQDE